MSVSQCISPLCYTYAGTTGTSSSVTAACSAVAALVGVCLAAAVGFLYWKKSRAAVAARSMVSFDMSEIYSSDGVVASAGHNTNTARLPSPARAM